MTSNVLSMIIDSPGGLSTYIFNVKKSKLSGIERPILLLSLLTVQSWKPFGIGHAIDGEPGTT